MLFRWYHIISLQVFLNNIFDDGFHDLTDRWRQACWTIVTGKATVSLLNTGVIKAFFHKSWSVEQSNNLLNKIERGMHNSLADSLRQSSCQPSGPGDFVGFSCFSLFNTMAGVIVISVSLELELSSWHWGIYIQSSSVKTLMKKSLNMWHLSWSTSTIELSSCLSELIDVHPVHVLRRESKIVWQTSGYTITVVMNLQCGQGGGHTTCFSKYEVVNDLQLT